ncbi:MAG: hypothetical protein A2172_02365 [Candidatus Woykebacteria bacterium RBG_13_40_15]|uniref:Uncharacterized protein n=1 Tax=Candidatus Woykebacteria bacterium RBG_13_40_15 TaxID=1802593 RepID=A0A1G1W6J1_9BACT|nr:MAG: hypothetical protein A2172_02365 [Candidatus Woykebacteria bacterium RBG_13_40_15]
MFSLTIEQGERLVVRKKTTKSGPVRRGKQKSAPPPIKLPNKRKTIKLSVLLAFKDQGFTIIDVGRTINPKGTFWKFRVSDDDHSVSLLVPAAQIVARFGDVIDWKEVCDKLKEEENTT